MLRIPLHGEKGVATTGLYKTTTCAYTSGEDNLAIRLTDGDLPADMRCLVKTAAFGATIVDPSSCVPTSSA